MVALFAISLLLVTSQVHGSSSLSASEHEHSPEIAGLFDWLKENGAKVHPPSQCTHNIDILPKSANMKCCVNASCMHLGACTRGRTDNAIMKANF